MAQELVAVRFVRGLSPYQAGEVAAFSPEKAQELLTAGYAVPYEADASKPAEVPAEIETGEDTGGPRRKHRKSGEAND